MNRVKCIIASVIFCVLTFINIFVPGGAELIENGSEKLNQNTDYTAVAEYIKSVLKDDKNTLSADSTYSKDNNAKVPHPLPASIVNSSLGPAGKDAAPSELLLYKKVDSDEIIADTVPEATDAVGNDIATEETVSTEESEAAEILPEAVQIFLDSQEAFSQYELPANVTYSFTGLPFEFASPLGGRSSSGFGYRLHPILNEVKFHYGTDIAAWSGESITSFAEGTVTFSGYSDSYGNYITIDHGNGWKSLYAHCSSLLVSSGESVAMGQQIALVGSTGLATGPHLHFELIHDGIYTNPEYYINFV